MKAFKEMMERKADEEKRMAERKSEEERRPKEKPTRRGWLSRKLGRKAYLEDIKNMMEEMLRDRQDKTGWPKRDDCLPRSNRGQSRKVEGLPRD
jgi:hypothetical protein